VEKRYISTVKCGWVKPRKLVSAKRTFGQLYNQSNSFSSIIGNDEHGGDNAVWVGRLRTRFSLKIAQAVIHYSSKQT